MTSYAATITPAGITADDFATTYAKLVAAFQSIYGVDAYLGNDSQDGQWIGIIAQAISDCNAAAVAVYNAFSPTTAQGAGLSSNVKLNGLTRLLGSFSTVPVFVQGQANVPINGGVVEDGNGNLWTLPNFTMSNSGSTTVTATCQTIGAIAAAAGSVNIATPIYGWQSASFSSAATPGNPVETDAALRVRQSNSVALPSVGVFDGIVAAIAQVVGVTRIGPYENNSNTTNGLGIPANTLAFAVEGGNVTAIQTAIASKLVGIGTYATGAGAQSATIIDAKGYSKQVSFMQCGLGAPNGTFATIGVTLQVHTLNGWASSTAALIQSALVALINSVPIGGTVNVAQLVATAQLLGTPQAPTFIVKSLTINQNGGSFQGTDISLNFNIAAVSNTGVITVSLV